MSTWCGRGHREARHGWDGGVDKCLGEAHKIQHGPGYMTPCRYVRSCMRTVFVCMATGGMDVWMRHCTCAPAFLQFVCLYMCRVRAAKSLCKFESSWACAVCVTCMPSSCEYVQAAKYGSRAGHGRLGYMCAFDLCHMSG